ncbi:hypothetical protein BDP27DRAFT_1452046 [Rhodocollybia butyracea]|uniref:Uncharacterized protein n=1 Tax=Rhodocollybia butyracea TaxID=206335 RepID=A0A9P5PEG5_9AGAR|nr:hypothetical protein BDP27DRAFT_1452046 [Rhodocollybia butyracea]
MYPLHNVHVDNAVPHCYILLHADARPTSDDSILPYSSFGATGEAESIHFLIGSANMPLFTLSPDDYDKKSTTHVRSTQNESRAGVQFKKSHYVACTVVLSFEHASKSKPQRCNSAIGYWGVILDGKYLLFPKSSHPTPPTPGPSRSPYAPTHPYAPANADNPGASRRSVDIGDRQCPDPTFDLEASLRSPASSTSTLLEPEAWEKPKVEDAAKIHETLMQHGIIVRDYGLPPFKTGGPVYPPRNG